MTSNGPRAEAAIAAIAQGVVERLLGPPELLVDQIAEQVAGRLGPMLRRPIPTPAVDGDHWPTEGSRLRKASCRSCGYTIRATRKWLTTGLPGCPCGGTIEPDVPPTQVPLEHERAMLSLAEQGMSTRAIAETLTGRSLIAPGGRPYQHTTVGNVLRRLRGAREPER